MNKENKYYTPERSEFHVGFEYERNDGGDWYKKISNGYDFSDINTMLNKAEICVLATQCKTENEFKARMFELPFADKLSKQLIANNPNTYRNGIRVKYLDKEDIESLGWVSLCLNKQGEEVYLMIENGEPTYWRLLTEYSFDNTSVYIYNIRNNIGFKGFIRNKSELNKLMKQLGI